VGVIIFFDSLSQRPERTTKSPRPIVSAAMGQFT